jgi:hypothetical protein
VLSGRLLGNRGWGAGWTAFESGTVFLEDPSWMDIAARAKKISIKQLIPRSILVVTML